MVQLTWTAAAARHADQIRAYIALDSPQAARAMVQRLRQEARRLAQFPDIGRVVPEYRDPAIREVIVAPYRLIYHHEAGAIAILAVIHGSRQLPGLP